MWQDPVPREISVMFARAMAGVDGETTCRTPDGQMARLERSPAQDVVLRVRIEDGQGGSVFPLTSFAPVAERPSAYPLDLPFVRGRAVTLAVGRGQRILGWVNTSDPEHLFEQVVQQSRADGWDVGGTKREFLGSSMALRKGSSERVLLWMWLPPVVKLLEREVTHLTQAAEHSA